MIVAILALLAIFAYLFIANLTGMWPQNRCPSGKPHRVVIQVVTDYRGRQWCFHRDCMRDSFRIVRDERKEAHDMARKLRRIQGCPMLTPTDILRLEDYKRLAIIYEDKVPAHFMVAFMKLIEIAEEAEKEVA